MNAHLTQTGKKRVASAAGFSLIEVLVAVCIFLIIGIGVYFTYANIIDVIGRTRIRTLATSLLNKQVEFIRNLPFDSVGIVGGYPIGVIPASTTVAYEGHQFVVGATVRNIDDPFDGKQGQSPNDTAPADFRLAELTVTCPTCFNMTPLTFTTWVAPQHLESSTKNGSLFVNVFDANGQPISNASVQVRNTQVSPTITITDTTNNSGSLQLVDVPTSTNAYQITVSKNGYTSRQTYTPGAVSNPNPVQPHATVATQQITSVSFAIDRTSTITAYTQDQYCAPVGSVGMSQAGQKKIGTGPDVLLYNQPFTTDAGGVATRSGLEWDSYGFTITSALHHLAGYTPLLPISIIPNTSTSVAFLVVPAASSSLLVSASNASGSPIADAHLTISKIGFSDDKYAGRAVHIETDWSNNRFTAQDGFVATGAPTSSLTIVQNSGVYATGTNSYLESLTIDFGTATTTFRDIVWSPTSQPAGTSLRFQIASASGSAGPWNYYGPDGTSASYYSATSSIGTMHNGARYLRYKAYLNTTSENATPQLDDVSIGFSSACVPSGHGFFAPLTTGVYTVTAQAAGYQMASSSITIGSGWHEVQLVMP